MSKFVSDLASDLQSIDEIADDFKLLLMSIKFDDSDEVTTKSTQSVSRIEVDSENQECLFFVTSNDEALSIANTKKEISTINSDYYLCAATKDIDDDSKIRLDNPIIGFGENIELKQFFIVCEAH